MSTTTSSQLLVAPQDIFSTSATKYSTLGAKVTLGDGRSFRYCLAGATALVPGKLQQSSAEDTTNYQNLTPTATAAGAVSVVTSSTVTATANILTDGYMIVTVTPGQGYVYQIGGNAAASSAALTVTLNDPIQVALTTSSRIDLVTNPFSSVVVNPTTATSSPAGVAVYPVTAAQYGWIQVQGVAPVLADGAVTVGTQLVASNGTAGAVEALTGVQAIVGTAVTGIATTEYGAVNLELA